MGKAEKMHIRALRPDDRTAWEPLWQGYLKFYKVDLPSETTETSWSRFQDPGEPVHALGAFAEDGKLLGIAHYIFHRSTWSASNHCYLNDLFTIPEARRQGVGERLIEEVYRRAAEAGATRVHWLTHETNLVAQSLYDRVADRAGFIQFRKNL